jgi:hypothetical protein
MSDHAKKPMKSTITDDDRRKQTLHDLSSIDKSIKAFNKGVSADTKQLDKLVDDYSSTPEAFDDLVASAFSRRQQEIDEIWKRRQAMLQHIEPEEWQAIVSSAKASAKHK